MATDYEINVDLLVSKIATALLADKDFMDAVMNGVRPAILKDARRTGTSLGRFGGSSS